MVVTRVLRQYLIITLCLFLGACVSTRNETAQVDSGRALESHVTLALKYIQDKNRESARHHLRRAFEIDRRSVDATFAMAMLYQLEAEPELAEEHFKRALRLNSKHTRARNNFGVFLYDQARYEEAYQQFEQAAADLDYNNRAQVMMNQGRAALKLDMIDKGKALFEHANQLNTNLPALKYELAQLSYQQEDYAAARRYLDAYEGIARPTAASLLLGIKLERRFDNKDKEASYALLLKNRFPYSQELLEYQRLAEED